MKIELATKEIIHFIGIGGIGMSGLSLIMKGKGFKVQGSDISNNKNIERLKREKIKIFVGHKKQNIDKATILVISSAIKKNYKISKESNEIEKKIYELRNIDYDIFENGDDYIVYKIQKINQRKPDLNDDQTKREIIDIVFQKNKFDYNQELINKINNNEFNNNDFLKMGQNQIQTLELNSIKDNKKFDINAVEILYSLRLNSFTLINDDKNNIYLAKTKNFTTQTIEKDKKKLDEFKTKQNSNIKNNILNSYDQYLSKKYEVVLNQKTIERVKNFFK